jgi:hypothetical protein
VWLSSTVMGRASCPLGCQNRFPRYRRCPEPSRARIDQAAGAVRPVRPAARDLPWGRRTPPVTDSTQMVAASITNRYRTSLFSTRS